MISQIAKRWAVMSYVFISLVSVFIVAVSSLALAEGHDKAFDAQIRFRYFYDVESDIELGSVDEHSNGGEVEVNPLIWNSVPNKEWEQRMSLSYELRATESFRGRFGILYNGYGISTDRRQWKTGGSTSSPRGLDLGDQGLLVGEAFGRWFATDNLSVEFGRSYLTLSEGSVLSSNDYQQVPIAWDGFSFNYNTELFNSRLLFAEISNAGTRSLSTLRDIYDRRFWGLSVDVKSLEAFETFNFHVMQIESQPSWQRAALSLPWPDENFETAEWRYGLAFGGDFVNMDYNFVFSSHKGNWVSEKGSEDEKTMNLSGYMFDIKAGYSFPELGDLRFHGGFHMDSGSDGNADNGLERYDSFYYDFHGNAGDMDVLQWGNLTYYNIGVSLEPMEELVFGVDYFVFSTSEEGDDFHSLDRSMAAFSSESLGASNGFSRYWNKSSDEREELGSELDVWVSKKYGTHLSMSLKYGLFTPGDYFSKSDGTGYDSYSRFFIQTSLAF